MRTLTLALLIVSGCVSNPDCLDLLPAKKYIGVFVWKSGLDSFFCSDQEHPLDLSNEQGLRDSFDPSCTVTLDRQCGEVTTMVAECFAGIRLTCYIEGLLGRCTHYLGSYDDKPLECQYDLWLDPVDELLPPLPPQL